MASIHAASLIVLILVAPIAVYATTHTVTWDLGSDYSDWASKDVYVGDEIVFTYANGAHNVYAVDKEGYANCQTSGSSFSDDSGSTKYELTKEGPVYFICGFFGHCPGMKLEVNVKASASNSSPPSPPPPGDSSAGPTSPPSVLSPPTSAASPATPPMSAPKDNGAVSHGLSRLVLGGSVIFGTLLI